MYKWFCVQDCWLNFLLELIFGHTLEAAADTKSLNLTVEEISLQ